MNKFIRRIETTVLIGTEGDKDKAFCDYLYRLYYSTQQSIFRIKIVNTHGGSPKQTVSRTITRTDSDGFDSAFSVIDVDRNDHTDPNNLKEAIKHAKLNKITLIKHEPLCLEGMSLSILEEKIPLTSMQCKSKLKKICGKNPFNLNNLMKNFPKSLLDKRRKSVQSLDQLIDLFTGNF
jgi:hypothetical protein